MFITTNKIFYHPQAISSISSGDIISPISIDIHLSNACNNSCQYCGAVRNDSERMTENTINKTIEFITTYKVKGAILTGGGEPTTNEHFSDVVKSLNSAGVDVGVITNGVKFPQETIEQVIPLAKWIRISLDASDPVTYKKIRGTDHYNTVINNIKAMLEYKRSIMASCTVGVQIVVNEHNLNFGVIYNNLINELPDISYIHIRPIEIKITEFPYSYKNLMIIRKGLESIKGKSKLILSDKWELLYNNREFGFNTCHAVNPINVITPNGDIYLCCHHIGNDKYKIGNINQSEYIANKKTTLHNLGSSLGFNKAFCPLGCRGSQINIAIETMLNEPHKNFL